MSTLYEITGQYLQLLEMLEDQDAVMDNQILADTLEGIDGEFEIKADGYARVIRELEADAQKYETEIRRMQGRMEVIKNRTKMIKQHLYDSMKVTGKIKFKTDLFSFGIQKNGGLQPMEIVPDVEIPDEYCRKEPDNTKIREALKNGVELPFAVLKERGEHLSIR